MGFPCIRYHATEAPRRVLNEAEEKALGPGWFDSPKKAIAPPTPPASDSAIAGLNVKEAVAVIETMTDAVALQAIADADSRVGVKKAVAERLEALASAPGSETE